MEYRVLGNSELNVSVIGQGTWALGGDQFGENDEALSIRCIHEAIELGVNLIDTAPAYGLNRESEKIIGKALKGRRDKAIIATKVGVIRKDEVYFRTLDPKVMRDSLEKSLKAMNTDYIDLYQIHWPNNDDEEKNETALELMKKFKEEGKIRAIGVSNFSVQQINKAIEIADISSVQPPLSLLDRRSIENGVLDYCFNNNIGVISYGTLGGGILAGREKPIPSKKERRMNFYHFYDDETWGRVQNLLGVLKEIAFNNSTTLSAVAINWALMQKGITSVLVGSRKPEMALQNIKSVEWKMSERDKKNIDEAYKRIINNGNPE